MIKYDVPLNLEDENNLHKLIKKVKPNSIILEFGPSTGRLTKFLKESLHCNVYGVEIDEDAYVKCKEYLTDGLCGDIETYYWVEKFKGIQFDYIIFADVLEHLRNPKDVIIKAKSFLKNDGQILVSIPNIAHSAVINELLNNRFDYRETGLLDNTHIHFFTIQTCIDMFQECGYHVAYSDGTYAESYDTELANSMNGFPKSVRQFLSVRDYANVYQIIFAFSLHECEEENYLVNIKNRDVFSKVYMDTGEGFHEAQILYKKIDLTAKEQVLHFDKRELLKGCKSIAIELVNNFYNRSIVYSITADYEAIPYTMDSLVVCDDDNYMVLNDEKLIIQIGEQQYYQVHFRSEIVDSDMVYAVYCNAYRYAKMALIEYENKKDDKNKKEIRFFKRFRQQPNLPKIAVDVISINTSTPLIEQAGYAFHHYDGFQQNLQSEYVLLCFDDAKPLNGYLAKAIAMCKNGYVDLVYSDCKNNHQQACYKSDFSYEYLIQQATEYDVLFIKSKVYNKIANMFDLREVNTSYVFMLKAVQVTKLIGHVKEIGYICNSLDVEFNESIVSCVKENVSSMYGNHVTCIEQINDYMINLRFNYIEDKPKIALIIPMKDKFDLSYACIKSIVTVSTYENYEIIILDNNSEEEETFAWLKQIEQQPHIRVVKAGFEFNWSKLNNFGIKQCEADVYIFLNNDTIIITPDWMERMAEDALRPDSGVVGALLLYDDDTIQHAGVVLGMNDFADHIYKQVPLNYDCTLFISPLAKRNVMAVTGACMAISKATLNKIGNFNDTFIICGSDVEICIRAYKYGLKNIYDPYVRLYHLESKSRDSYIPPIDFEMSIKHYAPYREQGDPYFNPNLSKKDTTPKKG